MVPEYFVCKVSHYWLSYDSLTISDQCWKNFFGQIFFAPICWRKFCWVKNCFGPFEMRNVFTWSTTYSQHSLSRLLCGLSKRRRCVQQISRSRVVMNGAQWQIPNWDVINFHPTCFSHHWRWPGHSGTCASREPSCWWQPLVWEFTMASPWLGPHAFTATNLSFRAKP